MQNPRHPLLLSGKISSGLTCILTLLCCMDSSSLTPFASAPGPITASPAKTLRQALAEKRSGLITVTDPNDLSVGWRVYFGRGQIYFAESISGQWERLSYLLSGQIPQAEINRRYQFPSDYTFLNQAQEVASLAPQHLQELWPALTQEALTQFLAIPQGPLLLEPSNDLDPLLLGISHHKRVIPMRAQISQWVLMRPDLSSPFQRPVIHNWELYDYYVDYFNKQQQQLEVLKYLQTQQLCFYQLACHFGMQMETVVTVLYPLIKAGALRVVPYRHRQQLVTPLVACIDDNPTTQRLVNVALGTSGYKIVQLADPTLAIAALLEDPPALIVIASQMKQLDGYQVCRAIREKKTLRHIPIVMLTETEGLLDRLRIRLSGAALHLTKPFRPQDLLVLALQLAPTWQLTPPPATNADALGVSDTPA